MLKRICCLLAALLFLYSSSYAESKKVQVIRNGDRNVPQIAITVDDCFDLPCFEQVLDLCEQYHIPVTFFVCGGGLKDEARDIYLRALRDGCEFGNHTYAHAALTQMDKYGIQRQLVRTDERLNEVLGFEYPMNAMRPPYGKLQRKDGSYISTLIAKYGYSNIIMWDISQTDAKKAFPKVKNGSIMLFHTKPRDVKCLTTLIPQLLEAGFEPVTISTLLGIDAPAVPEEVFAAAPDEAITEAPAA